jgi:uncharacterized membrane protein
MGKGRLEAFSDGVLAIIITIMVLELKVPHGDRLEDLLPLLPVLMSYVLSFIYVGIYWNNHHHMLHVTQRVSGGVLWANLHLLFWLSLIPAATAWMGENHFARWPVVVYGLVLLACSLAWPVLQHQIVVVNGRDSLLSTAVGRDLKGKLSTVAYVLAIALAFVRPWLAGLVYLAVALLWLVPDRRIEARVRG